MGDRPEIEDSAQITQDLRAYRDILSINETAVLRCWFPDAGLPRDGPARRARGDDPENGQRVAHPWVPGRLEFFLSRILDRMVRIQSRRAAPGEER